MPHTPATILPAYRILSDPSPGVRHSLPPLYPPGTRHRIAVEFKSESFDAKGFCRYTIGLGEFDTQTITFRGLGKPMASIISRKTDFELGIGTSLQPTPSEDDTSRSGAWMSPLTAQGRSAIAVIRVWGPRLLEISDAVFRPRRGARLRWARRARLRLGRIGHGLGDEVVAVVLAGDPPAVEIQCHGGPAAISLVVDALQAAGATVADGVGWPNTSLTTRSLVTLSSTLDGHRRFQPPRSCWIRRRVRCAPSSRN